MFISNEILNISRAEMQVWITLTFYPPPQDLSFQTAARILAAPSVDALNVMKDLSQNFPTKAR